MLFSFFFFDFWFGCTQLIQRRLKRHKNSDDQSKQNNRRWVFFLLDVRPRDPRADRHLDDEEQRNEPCYMCDRMRRKRKVFLIWQQHVVTLSQLMTHGAAVGNVRASRLSPATHTTSPRKKEKQSEGSSSSPMRKWDSVQTLCLDGGEQAEVEEKRSNVTHSDADRSPARAADELRRGRERGRHQERGWGLARKVTGDELGAEAPELL